jgi:hypothetical protein
MRALGVSAAGACAPRIAEGQAAPGAELDQRLAMLVQEYDRQGTHRTGTRGDLLSAQWLSTQMQAWRVSAQLEPFAFPRVEVANAYLQERTRRLDGVPLYDATFTDEFGVFGRVGPPQAGTEVAVVASDDAAWPGLRRATRAAAIVLVAKGARAGLAPQDALDYGAPFGPPVLQVSSEEAAWLREQIEKQASVRVVVDAKREPAQAFNVFARVRGRDPAAAPLVVTASRSGWWRAASERGGGLACLLEAVRAATVIRPVRDCVFAAVTGSEIGDLGTAALNEKHPELRTAGAWVRLGANLGAAARGTLVAECTDEILATSARDAAAGTGADVEVRRGSGDAAGPAGGRLVSLFTAGNPYARLASDRWPDALSLPALASQAAVVVALVRSLAAR